MLARIANWVFGFGFTMSIIAVIVSPEKYNMAIAALYIGMFILRNTSFKQSAKGRLMEESSGLPLSFGIIRVLSAQTGVEISHGVADQMGRYYILVPNGTYSVKIEKKNDDGSYSIAHTSGQFEVKNGTLNRAFNI